MKKRHGILGIFAVAVIEIYLSNKTERRRKTAICTASFKKNIAQLTEWYKVQLEKLNADVRLNTEIQADNPILAECDNIIIGCGAKPIVPPIPGIDGDNVATVLDGHRNPALIQGENIIVCGGASGCDGAQKWPKTWAKKSPLQK